MPYIHSLPYNKILQEKISKGENVDLKFLDKNARNSTILNLIFNAFIEKKTICWIVNQDISRESCIETLDQFGLLNYVLDHRNSELFAEENVAKLRAKVLGQNISHAFNSNEYQILNKLLTEFNLGFKKEILGERNWLNVLESLIKIEKEHPNLPSLIIDSSVFSWNQREYYYLLGRIEKASKIYDRELIKSTNSSSLFENTTLNRLNVPESRNRIAKNLEDLLQKAISLRESYQLFIYTLIDSDKKKRRKNRDELIESIINFQTNHPSEASISSEQSQNSFFSFIGHSKKEKLSSTKQTKRLELIIQRAKEMGFQFNDLEFNSENNNWQTWNLIQEIQNQNYALFEKQSTQFLNGINLLNTENNQFKEISKTLNTITNRINKSKYFREKVEVNSHSILRQRDAINEIVKLLEDAIYSLNYSARMNEWLSFLEDLNESGVQIIHLLKQYPKNLWVIIFDRWYLSELLRFHQPPYQEYLKKSIDRLPELSINHLKELIKETGTKWDKSLVEIVNEIAISDKRLYKNIFKKKSGFERAETLSESIGKMLMHAFPIHLVTPENPGQIDILSKLDFDIVINVCDKPIDDFQIKKLGKQRINVDQEISEKKPVQKINSYIPLSTPLIELNQSARLQQSKIIGLELLKINQGIQIFQSKDKSILSCVHPLLDISKMNALKNQGLNQLPMGEEQFNSVTESILEIDKQQIIILQEGLINPHFQHFDYQLSFIQTLKDIGFKLISLSLIDLFENKGQSNESIIKEIFRLTQENKTLIEEID